MRIVWHAPGWVRFSVSRSAAPLRVPISAVLCCAVSRRERRRVLALLHARARVCVSLCVSCCLGDGSGPRRGDVQGAREPICARTSRRPGDLIPHYLCVGQTGVCCLASTPGSAAYVKMGGEKVEVLMFYFHHTGDKAVTSRFLLRLLCCRAFQFVSLQSSRAVGRVLSCDFLFSQVSAPNGPLDQPSGCPCDPHYSQSPIRAFKHGVQCPLLCRPNQRAHARVHSVFPIPVAAHRLPVEPSKGACRYAEAELENVEGASPLLYSNARCSVCGYARCSVCGSMKRPVRH